VRLSYRVPALALAAALAAFAPSWARAQAIPQILPQTDPDYPRGRISGLVFLDYYWNADGDPQHHYGPAGADTNQVNINGRSNIGEELNGVQIRRVYFQYDNDLTVKYTTRFRLEVDGRALDSENKLTVNLKNAYLLVKNVVPRGNFFVGMLSTPIWENVEGFWKYRSIERTIADFRGIGNASDMGVELKGFLDDDHRIGYMAMIGNGTGQSPETNLFKKGYVSIPLVPIKNLKFEPYWDYMGGPNDLEQNTYKLFTGYELNRGAVGFEIVDRLNHSPSGTVEPFGYSLFARMAPSAKIAAVARFDHWESNTRSPNRVDSNFYIAGLDWSPTSNVHLMPNVEIMTYDGKGTAVAPAYTDVQARLTFYYSYSKP